MFSTDLPNIMLSKFTHYVIHVFLNKSLNLSYLWQIWWWPLFTMANSLLCCLAPLSEPAGSKKKGRGHSRNKQDINVPPLLTKVNDTIHVSGKLIHMYVGVCRLLASMYLMLHTCAVLRVWLVNHHFDDLISQPNFSQPQTSIRWWPFITGINYLSECTGF